MFAQQFYEMNDVRLILCVEYLGQTWSLHADYLYFAFHVYGILIFEL